MLLACDFEQHQLVPLSIYLEGCEEGTGACSATIAVLVVQCNIWHCVQRLSVSAALRVPKAVARLQICLQRGLMCNGCIHR